MNSANGVSKIAVINGFCCVRLLVTCGFKWVMTLFTVFQWDKVHKEKFQILEHQMNPSNNFTSYRSSLKAALWRSEGAVEERQKVDICMGLHACTRAHTHTHPPTHTHTHTHTGLCRCGIRKCEIF